MSEEKISYCFSDLELKNLALYFRNCSEQIPKPLEGLAEFVENYVYSSMTIEEAENFFKS